MKKKYKIILAVIIAVWIFGIALEINSYCAKRLGTQLSSTTDVTQPVAVAQNFDSTTTTQTQTETTTKAKATKEKTTKADTTKKSDKTTETATKADGKSVKATTEVTTKKSKTTDTAATTKVAEKSVTDKTTASSSTTTQPQSETTTVKEIKSKPATWSEKTVLKKLRAAINQLESNTDSFKITEVKSAELEIINCSQDSLYTALNNIVQGFAGEKEIVYNFENGIATDSNGVTVTPDEVLLPLEGSFKLSADNIAYAAAERSGVNVMLTVKIGRETVDYTSVPVNHAAGIGYINFSKLSFSPASITSAQVLYKRSTIRAIINSKGELVSLYGTLPFRVTATGRLGKAVDATVSGKVTWTWKTQ